MKNKTHLGSDSGHKTRQSLETFVFDQPRISSIWALEQQTIAFLFPRKNNAKLLTPSECSVNIDYKSEERDRNKFYTYHNQRHK